jgi:tetratricopeptide (TPR) repeat protein
MKVKFAAALLLGVSCWAQTSAELLQKGIYEQETAGNLDNAILIYCQIVNSAPSQRDVAAQAQYRLAQALLQKGNMAEASKEFDRLARDYADYSSLVSSLAGQVRPGTYRFNLVTAGRRARPGHARTGCHAKSEASGVTGQSRRAANPVYGRASRSRSNRTADSGPSESVGKTVHHGTDAGSSHFLASQFKVR